MSDFKVGDRVRIKSWEQMEKEFGLDTQRDINIMPSFVKDMRHLCGATATITDIGYKMVELDDWIPKNEETWNYTKDMIEKVEEEKEDMENEVLELWYERKRKEIEDDRERRYKVFKEKGNDFLAKYNDLVLEINEKLDSLVKEDNLYNEEQLLGLNTSFTGLEYKLNEKAVYSLFEKENYQIFDIQLDELNKTYEEVKAQLSLSNDLEYQLKVLKSYGIIDKKNKLSA